VLEPLIALPRPRNSAMIKVSRSPRHKEAPARATRAAARVALRREIADRRLRISVRLTSGLSIAHMARVEPLAVRRTRQAIAGMVASRERDLKANGVVRKWRRKVLKRLNPGAEMVVARKPRTHKIWYPGTNRISGHARCERDRSSCSQWRAPRGEGNFPPRKPLKLLETRKESRSRPG